MSRIHVRLKVPERPSAVVAFGITELTSALESSGYKPGDGASLLEITVALTQEVLPDSLGAVRPPELPESYAIARPSPSTMALIGSDDRGLMYACLDLAEQLQMGVSLEETSPREASPELPVRGLYSLLHNAEAERERLYSREYWRGLADSLARCRYNRFNLVFGNQTAFLIPIYAFTLDDLDEEFPQVRVKGISSEERARNLRAIQTASEAMSDRGIDFFLGIWQCRPWTVAGGERANQPTRVTGLDDVALLSRYTQRGFLRLMEECPKVTGIQLRMNPESGVIDQRFFAESFVPALKAMAEKGRTVTVELRSWRVNPGVFNAFREAGGRILVSSKYFAEHQALPYQPPAIRDVYVRDNLPREGYSYDSLLRRNRDYSFLWHFWNLGSHRLFSWGDPDYARRFVRSCHLGDGIGFEVTQPGSQKGYSEWGQVNPGDWQPRRDLPAQAPHDRYWFFHMAFGRMGYDPSTKDEVFLHQLALRTSRAAAPKMLEAYRAASQVVSYLISQRMDDQNMYVWPELDCGGTIDHNSIAPVGEATLFYTPREYAHARVVGETSAKLSPFDAARDLDRFADEIEESLQALSQLPYLAEKLEYRAVQKDFAALAALSRYHAAKSRATGNLCLFYASGERRFLDAAEADGERGVALWDELCAATEDYYPRLHFGPSGGHWRDNRSRVAYDLRRIRRVREIFGLAGLFSRGFAFGQPLPERIPPRVWSGLEPEPRFTGVDAATRYTGEQGYGWVRIADLRGVGFYQLPKDVLWGVHYILPDSEYDPGEIDSVPLDSLTNRYLTAEQPHTFRVNVPDGEYEVLAVLPAGSSWTTPIRVGASCITLSGSSSVAKLKADARGGAIDVHIGGEGRWALSGLVIRGLAPIIAHLPPMAIPAEESCLVAATASAPDGLRSMVLRYRVGGAIREVPMAGDGAAFEAQVPATDLVGDSLEYEIRAEDTVGRVQISRHEVAVVRGFAHPRIVAATGPAQRQKDAMQSFTVVLENGEFAREVRMHYREADQNRAFRVATQPAHRSGEYGFDIDPECLDLAYEVIYYFEVLDIIGGGSFYPDPFREARYFVMKPA